MRPEEMKDDIPMDVREALARAMRGPGVWVNLQAELRDAIRAELRTVHLPAAELPAPLKELPASGRCWSWYWSHDMEGVAEAMRRAT